MFENSVTTSQHLSYVNGKHIIPTPQSGHGNTISENACISTESISDYFVEEINIDHQFHIKPDQINIKNLDNFCTYKTIQGIKSKDKT